MKPDSPDRRAGWFDHPVLSLLLAGAWLALSRSLEPVHLLSAALLGLLVPRVLRGVLPTGQTIAWGAAIRLTLVVLWDVLLSNVAVAALVLGPMNRPQPAWLRIPLACGHDRVNALFASIITMTPGTVSAVVDESARCIWVHALNCHDASLMVAQTKARYEAPLMQIFGIDAGGAK
jgi:multicomponent K+:H+ antiporter subunit E